MVKMIRTLPVTDEAQLTNQENNILLVQNVWLSQDELCYVSVSSEKVLNSSVCDDLIPSL